MANNALAINGRRITTHAYALTHRDFTPEGVIKLSFGKKKHVLIKPK